MYRIVLMGLGALVAMEVALRLVYVGLPSLSVEMQPFEPQNRPSVVATGPDLPLCHEPKQERPQGAGEAEAPPVGWVRLIPGEGEPLIVFVVGDSVALGAGVQPEQTYAYGIADRLGSMTSRPVKLFDLGYNAASYCGYLQELHHHLDRLTPDLVVVHMFADDLEQQALVLTGGVLRADPSQMDNPVFSSLLTHVYVANWVWWQGLDLVVRRATSGGGTTPEWVERGPRIIPQKTINNFGNSMVHVAERLQELGVAQFTFLTSPVGWGLCPEMPSPTSECGWLAHDMHAMSAKLDATKVSWSDMKDIWGSDLSSVQDLEMRFYREQGRLPIHPNEDGHRRILEAVWPSIEALWMSR
ncbi:MAG: SGNH/GDSL hydrolase family protein [Myxococcota bacterium]